MKDAVNSVDAAFAELQNPTETITPEAVKEEKEVVGDDEGGALEPEETDEEYLDSITDTAFAILDSAKTTCFKIAANQKRKKRALQVDKEHGISRLLQLRAEREANAKGGSKNVEIVNNHTGTDAKLVQLDLVVDEFIEDLPFTDAQIKMMRPGLRTMVKKNAGNIPPELLFYAGLATAIGGNLADFLML